MAHDIGERTIFERVSAIKTDLTVEGDTTRVKLVQDMNSSSGMLVTPSGINISLVVCGLQKHCSQRVNSGGKLHSLVEERAREGVRAYCLTFDRS